MSFKRLFLNWFCLSFALCISSAWAGIKMPLKKEDVCRVLFKELSALVNTDSTDGITIETISSGEAVNLLNDFKRNTLKTDADGVLNPVSKHSNSLIPRNKLIAGRIQGIQDFHSGKIPVEENQIQNIRAWKITDPDSIIKFLEKIGKSNETLSWPNFARKVISSAPLSITILNLFMARKFYQDGDPIFAAGFILLYFAQLNLSTAYDLSTEYDFSFERLKNRVTKQIRTSQNNKWSFRSFIQLEINLEKKTFLMRIYDLLFTIQNGKPQLVIVERLTSQFPEFPKKSGNSRQRKSAGLWLPIPGLAGSR